MWRREDDLQFDYFHAPVGAVLQGRPSAATGCRRPGCSARRFRRSGRTFERQGEVRRLAGRAWDSPTSRSASPTCASRTARRRRTCASAGCARWPHPSCLCGAELHRRARSARQRRPRRVPAETDRRAAGHRLRRRGHERLESRNPTLPVRHGATARVHRASSPRSPGGRRRSQARAAASASPLTGASSRTSLPSSKSRSAKRARFRSRASIIAVDAGTIVNPGPRHLAVRRRRGFWHEPRADQRDDRGERQDPGDRTSTLPGARMTEAPRMTHVHLVASTAAPAGVGEPGVPPIAPASATRSSRPPASVSASSPSRGS